MIREAARTDARISFEPGAAASIVQRVRNELAKSTVATVIIDMDAVENADPAALRTLQEAGEAAHDAGKDILLDRVRTTVYKSLYLAKLGMLFKRVQHAA